MDSAFDTAGSARRERWRIAGERWALRLAIGRFSDSDELPYEVSAALRELLGVGRGWARSDAAEAIWGRARERLENLPGDGSVPAGTLGENLSRLGEYLRLSGLEQELLRFRVVASLFAPLRNVLKAVGDCDDVQLADTIGVALDAPPEAVLGALSRDSALPASGLLTLANRGLDPTHRLTLVPGLTAVLGRRHDSLESLLEEFVTRTPASTLSEHDFHHLGEQLRLLVAYLRSAGAEDSRGRNVLIHGEPGTGKTELARLATRMAGLRLYAADVCGEDGQPLDVRGRLQSLVFLQRLLSANAGAVALIDEIEDVFKPTEGPEPEGRTVAAADSKGWTVRLLETNRTPTLWISNRVSQIDPAVLRRFDLVIEARTPPLAVRRRIVERALGRPLGSAGAIDRILRDAAPAPALLSRAAQVLSSIGSDAVVSSEAAFATIVGGHLRVLGIEPRTATPDDLVPFDPRFINGQPSPAHAIELLRSGHANRVLILGPSGSGKTALSRYLAAELGLPLVSVTPRDLVPDRPGSVERKLRRAFEHAERDGVVLLLDQVEWLIGARVDDRAAHELAALDQLYACLDAHPGIVVCTTCRLRGLEAGIVRRFPLRIRLDHLDRERRLEVLARVLREVGAECALQELAPRVATMSTLTVGELLEAARQGLPLGSPSALLAALEEGQKLKADGLSNAIGFSARQAPLPGA